ncbi:MAG: DUF3047 domain-containing protein [Candidatus Rokuibacteriota bacterium]
MSRLLALPVLTVAGVVMAPPPPAAQHECIILDDVAKATVGQFPSGWKPRKDEGTEIYTVQEENGLRFLRAVSRGDGIQAARETDAWDLAAYPVLAWSWRPREFPRGADEKAGKNDSALAVYMLVPHSQVRGPKAVKYIWSERVPAGTELASNGDLTRVRVLRSGTAGLNTWTDERVNVLADYRRRFGEPGTPRPAGIAVLTDSDDTKSSASGDYANVRACRG